MQDYDSYFEILPIADALASIRVGTAMRRHDAHFYWQHLQGAASPLVAVPRASEPYLPPRRQWSRPPEAQRISLSSEALAKRSIMRVVCGRQRAGSLAQEPWGVRLHEFTSDLQRRMLTGNFALHPPQPMLIRKTKGRLKTQAEAQRRNAYRALATYRDLGDRILLSQTTRYLRDRFDPLLSDSCFSFRAKRGVSHSTAVEALLEYRRLHQGKRIYLAECDIVKFFDVLHHDVVREAFARFRDKSESKEESRIDPRAEAVLLAYLDSYTFRGTVLGSADPEIKRKREEIDCVDPKFLSRYYADPEQEPLGIPQGGALSPLIANLVMDEVDRSVLSIGDPDLFYARFCDDMIILHPDRKKCKAALDRYLEALESLRLPVHPVATKTRYGREFFESKSKGPILWARSSLQGRATPWVSFVGYQVRFDGQIRLREETIRKHQDKLRKEGGRIRQLLSAKGKCSFRSGSFSAFFSAVRMRIVAIGVGRRNQRLSRPSQRQLCWVDAFPLLTSNQYTLNQMRRLDKRRGRVINAIMRRLHVDSPSEIEEQQPKKLFFGKPFSYVGLLEKVLSPIFGKRGDDGTRAYRG